jgi:hypothetical protein
MRKRKGAITEINQVAGVVKSSLHEYEINNNQQASQYVMQGEGKETKQINGRSVGPWLGCDAACTEQMSADD